MVTHRFLSGHLGPFRSESGRKGPRQLNVGKERSLNTPVNFIWFFLYVVQDRVAAWRVLEELYDEGWQAFLHPLPYHPTWLDHGAFGR